MSGAWGGRRAWCVVVAAAAACSAPRETLGDPQAEIQAMLVRSAGDWNRGDLTAFMGDYARDSLTSYVSGGRVIYGWQTLYDSYATRYFGPGAARDSLAFTDVRVRPLTPNLALATARFCLFRRDSVTASGPFTIIVTRRSDGWKILHDHSQGDTKPWCTS